MAEIKEPVVADVEGTDLSGSPQVPIADVAIRRILDDLARGPKCAPNLALDLGFPKKALYAYLSELLGRQWIRVLPDPTGWSKRSPWYADFEAVLKSAVDAHERAHGGSDWETLSARTRSWHQFFRTIDRLSLYENRVSYYLALTEKGQKAIAALPQVV